MMEGLCRDDAGVSPVVGAAMILVITMGAIGVVMYWGLPNLHRAQAQATVDGIVDQFAILDDLAEDLGRQGGRSVSTGHLTVDQGGLVFDNAGTRWVVVYGVDRGSPLNVSLGELDDTDERYTILNHGSADRSGISVEHAVLDDGTFRTVDVRYGLDLTAGDPVPVRIRDGGGPYPIEGTVLRLRFYDGTLTPSHLAAEAWIVDAGALRYRLSAPAGFHAVEWTNGAISVETPTGSAIRGLDGVSTFRSNATEDPLVFVSLRRLQHTGGPTTAGTGDWTLSVRPHLDRTLTPSSRTAQDVRIGVAGDQADLWRRWMALETDGFDAEGDRVHRHGPVEISLFYHEVRFAKGFQPG